MKESGTIEPTFLSNSPVTHTDGEKYLVLETSSRTNEMLVLKLSNGRAYHYHNGKFTEVELNAVRQDGRYFSFGVVHNWIAGELEPSVQEKDEEGEKTP